MPVSSSTDVYASCHFDFLSLFQEGQESPVSNLPCVQDDGVRAEFLTHDGECLLHGIGFECFDFVHGATFRRESFRPELEDV